MRVFLDDVRECPEGWTLARSYEQAIQFLLTGEVTEISLDHDMGMVMSETYPWDPEPDPPHLIEAMSGYDVAAWIEEAIYFGKIPVLRMLCHSANPAGRKRIEAVIQAIERRVKDP